MNWTDEEITAGIEHCIDDADGIFLVDVKLNTSKHGHQLIVKCESDTGITIAQLAQINKSIHRNLDLPGLVMENLSVEVTSPGTGHPITNARHFKRFIDKTLNIEHRIETLQNPITAKLLGVEGEILRLEHETSELTLNLDDVVHGKVKMPW